MAKKTVDLFQLLKKRRSKGSFKIDPDPDPRAPVDLFGPVGNWFRNLLGKSPRRRRRPAKTRGIAGAAGILISGPTLAGVAFGCLVVGFLFGQGLAASGPEELQTSAGKVRPGWLPEPTTAAGVLPEHLQYEQLGGHVYLLGDYPVGGDPLASRAAAERLATHLRTQGLERTRIYKLRTEQGTSTWLTVYYTAGPGIEQAVLDTINSLDPPGFEPRWPEFLQRLAPHREPLGLTGSGG
jgi:hypothetical protein